MLSASTDEESGDILLDRKSIRSIAGAVREWTNTTHAAVMFEVTTMSDGVPSTADGLRQVRSRIAQERLTWSSDQGPEGRRLVRMLAISALEGLTDTCDATGRWRKPTSRVLDELLPKRSTRDTFFRVPDDRGECPAGLTLDFDTFSWHAQGSGERSAADARDTPLGRIAFGSLRRVPWKGDMGGDIVDGEGHVAVRFP